MLGSFKRHLLSSYKANKKISGYVSDVCGFIDWFAETNGEFSLDAVTSIDLREYKQYLVEIKKLAPRTVNRKLASLRNFFSWADSQGLLANGRLAFPKEIKTTETSTAPKSLTRQQQEALVRTVEQYGNERDTAIIKLVLNTGLRVSELCGLNRRDVDLKPRGGSVKVTGKGSKFRVIPLNSQAREALYKHLEKHPRKPEEKLFVGTRGPSRGASRRRP